MEPSYWKRYDRVFKHFSFKRIYEQILVLAGKLGNPFVKKSSRGPKFKINPYEYAAFIVFEIVTGDSKFRDMEQDSELFVQKHLDHSTFGKNFIKIPYDYLQRLLHVCAGLLESLLGTALAYIPDSTAVTTCFYKDNIREGKESRQKQTYKSHALVGYYPDKRIIYVKTAEGTNHHVSDSEGAVRMLKNYNKGWAYMPADKGYDYEKTYKAAEKAGLTSIIKKQKRANGPNSKHRKRSMYNETIYKELRPAVENNFGGLENKKLLNTTLKRPDNINKHNVIIHIRQTLYTYLRAIASSITLIIRQTPLKRKV